MQSTKSASQLWSRWIDRDDDVARVSGADLLGRLQSDERFRAEFLIDRAKMMRAVGNFVHILNPSKDIKVRYAVAGESSANGNDEVTLSFDVSDTDFDYAVGLALHEGSHILHTSRFHMKHQSQFIEEMLRHVNSHPGDPVQLAEQFCNMFTTRKGTKGAGTASQLKSIARFILANVPNCVGASRSSMNVRSDTPRVATNYFFERIFWVFNVLEDRRIDRLTIIENPGYADYYKALYDKYWLSPEITESFEKITSGKAKLPVTLEGYMFAITNMINPKFRNDLLPALPEIMALINVKNIGRLRNTFEVGEVSMRVWEIIAREVAKAKAEADAKAEQKRKRDQEKQDKKDKQEQDKQEQDKQDDQDGESGESEERDEDADGEDEGEGGKSKETRESDDDEENEGGDDDDAEGSESDEDDTDEDAEGSGSGDETDEDETDEDGEGSESGEGDESEDDDSDEDGDDDGDSSEGEDSDGDRSKNKKTSGKGRGQMDKSGEPESDEAGEDENEGDEDGDDDVPEMTNEEITKQLENIKRQVDGNVKKATTTKETNTQVEQVGSMKVDKNDVSYSGSTIGAKVFKNIKVMNETLPGGQKFSDHSLIAAFDQGVLAGKRLANLLQFRRESRTETSSHLHRGGMDKRLLYSAGFGAESIFQVKSTSQFKDIYVRLSIDCSGSMGGEKLASSVKLASMLVTALRQYGAHVVIDTRLAYSFETPVAVVEVYNSRFHSDKQFKTNLTRIKACGSTPESLCFAAIEEDMKRDAQGKESYFVNISDGEPGAQIWDKNHVSVNYGGSSAIEHCAACIRRMEKAGTQVLSYFITNNYSWQKDDGKPSDDFVRMYGAHNAFKLDCKDIARIAKAVNKKLLRAL